jgi:hypothetical protein
MDPASSSKHMISLAEASAMGVDGILELVSRTSYVFVKADEQMSAVVVHANRLSELVEREQDLLDLALIRDRLANDSGVRVPLDDVITGLGFTREDLESESAE